MKREKEMMGLILKKIESLYDSRFLYEIKMKDKLMYLRSEQWLWLSLQRQFVIMHSNIVLINIVQL